MDRIIISDLEVFFRVGVPDAERAVPQRLLVSVEMDCDLAAASASDGLDQTIDYDAVAQRVRRLGTDRSWKLSETLAVDIAELIRAEFRPRRVGVEVKKFIFRDARHVAVRVERPPPSAA